jgi:hypothetical protein
MLNLKLDFAYGAPWLRMPQWAGPAVSLPRCRAGHPIFHTAWMDTGRAVNNSLDSTGNATYNRSSPALAVAGVCNGRAVLRDRSSDSSCRVSRGDV